MSVYMYSFTTKPCKLPLTTVLTTVFYGILRYTTAKHGRQETIDFNLNKSLRSLVGIAMLIKTTR